MTDPISDMLTRIRNSQMNRNESAFIPYSELKLRIAQILLNEKWIKEIKKVRRKEHKFIQVFIRYNADKTPYISGLKRISKPGQRKYIAYKQIRKIRGGFGLILLSTPKGIMTGQQARKQKLGGEVICEIW